MARVALLIALGLVGPSCHAATLFACARPGDCIDGPIGGACELDGYCSFPDPGCETGRRYGEHAPDDIAGACVPGADEPPAEASDDESSTDEPIDAFDPTTEGGDATTDDRNADELDASTDGESSSGADEFGTEESGAGTSTGTADGASPGCDALDCASCMECAVQPDGPCTQEQSACDAANGCTSGVACQQECMLYGYCFEDCCHADLAALVDDVVLCVADHCIEACSEHEVLTCA
jgi:hypothetical protein